MTAPTEPQPQLNAKELQRLMTKHGVTADVLNAVYCMVARTHKDPVAATDIAFTTALAEGGDPLKVAMALSMPSENPE